MKKRITSIATLTAMATTMVITSCGGGNSQQTDTSAAGTTAPEVTTQSVESILGFEREDNGGKTFTILADENKAYDFDAEEATGDVVSDAVYEKNNAVEEYLGISLEFVYGNAGWNTRNEFNSLIQTDIMAGDGTYDLVSSPVVITTPIVQEGYFLDGNALNVNFDNPWWLSDMYERFSIAGKLYGFFGDYSLSLYKDLAVIFFNKRIWDEFDAPDPYELVRNNEWTLDKFLEVCSGMERDLNGDGTWTLEDDQLTYLSEAVPGGTYQTALELDVVKIADDGTPEYLGLTEKFASAYEKMATLMSRDDVLVVSSIDDLSYKSQKAFANGNVATMVNFLYSTEHLRDMNDDYGIIPIPKYDENQEKYHAQLGTSTEMLFVPKTTNDVALTSKVMETLGYYMKELVVPKYYEVALKEKYARDTEIREMLDIIREGAAMDFIFVYGTSLASAPNQYFRYQNKADIGIALASRFATNEKSFTTSLEKMIEKIAALD